MPTVCVGVVGAVVRRGPDWDPSYGDEDGGGAGSGASGSSSSSSGLQAGTGVVRAVKVRREDLLGSLFGLDGSSHRSGCLFF